MISRLLRTIDRNALSARAEFLRGGMKCEVDLPVAQKACFNFDVHGGRNYHGSIVFEDGITWLARFRLPNYNEPPIQEKNFDRRSEFATYKFLTNTAILVPQVYDIADDEDPLNTVGAGYILLEKLPGKPMAWDKASEEQKKNFSKQLADIYIGLEQHPFDKLGRLQLSPTGIPEVGPAFIDYGAEGEVTLIDLPPESGPFFLRQIDTRDANFLVDEEYNITGIIDWELATITSKGSAFQSPLLMYDLGQLYHEGLSTPCGDEKRFVKILQKEKGAVDLAKLAAQKLYFRVEQVLEANSFDQESLVGIFSGWWKLTKGMETFDWNMWHQQAQEKYGDTRIARALDEAQSSIII